MRTLARSAAFWISWTLRRRGSSGGQPFAHEIGVAHDDPEQVVEVVGHAPGQPPHGLELGRLQEAPLGDLERLLRPLSLGQVLHQAFVIGDPPVGVPHRHLADPDPEDRAVVAEALRFVVLDAALALQALEERGPEVGIAIGLHHAAGQELLAARIAEHSHEGQVAVEEGVVGGDAEEADGHAVVETPVAALRLLRGLSMPRRLEGAAHGGQEAGQLSPLLEHVVVEAGLHGFHRHLLAARPRVHDHGHVGPHGLDLA